LPFASKNYADSMLTVKVDVGASTLWSEAQSIGILDSLFDRKVIDVTQYLERLPKGIVPDISGLMEDMRGEGTSPSFTEDELLSGLSPEIREQLGTLAPEKQAQIIAKAMASKGAAI
jgi:hypothetical protein